MAIGATTSSDTLQCLLVILEVVIVDVSVRSFDVDDSSMCRCVRSVWSVILEFRFIVKQAENCDDSYSAHHYDDPHWRIVAIYEA